MRKRGRTSLLLSTFFFTLLQPGIVAGVVPYMILASQRMEVFNSPFSYTQYIGIFIFIAGFIIMMDCILRFVFEGRGTLSPADPTRQLVIHGLYRYTRNPMYVGVMLMLIGEAVFFESVSLGVYASGVLLMFHLFVLFVEEPRLKKDFGEAYAEYSRKVRRWV